MDFSGASLRLSTIGEKQVTDVLDKIDQKAQKVQQQVTITAKQQAEMWQKAQGSVQDFNRQVDELVARQQAAQAQVAATVATTAAKVTAATSSMSRTTVIGLGELARGIGQVAQSGTVGAYAMREFTGAMFRLGSFAGGEFLPVIGLIGYAMTEVFLKARREADAATNALIDDLDRLAKAHDLAGISMKRQEIFSGDPFATIEGKKAGESDTQFLYRAQGLQGLQARAEQLNAFLAQHPQSARTGGAEGTFATDPLAQQRKELQDIEDLLAKYGTQWTKYGQIQQAVQQGFTETAAAQLRAWREAADAHQRLVIQPANDQLQQLDKILAKEKPQLEVITERKDRIGLLRAQEAELRYEIDHGNLSLDQRITKAGELARVTKELTAAQQSFITIVAPAVSRLTGFGTETNAAGRVQSNIPQYANILQGGSATLPVRITIPDVSPTENEKAIAKQLEKMDEQAKRYSEEIGRTIANGITRGFETAIQTHSLGKGFEALTGAILQGLGAMLERVGEAALAGAQWLAAWAAHIAAFDPPAAIAAAIGLIALGAVLQGAGANMSRGASAGGGSGSYGSSATGGTIIDRGSIDPTAHSPVTNPATIQARNPVVNHVTIIGPNDPQAQRAWDELQRKSQQRGSLVPRQAGG